MPGDDLASELGLPTPSNFLPGLLQRPAMLVGKESR